MEASLWLGLAALVDVNGRADVRWPIPDPPGVHLPQCLKRQRRAAEAPMDARWHPTAPRP